MADEQDLAADTMPQYGVGDELRARREAMGRSIADVVDAVRIQGRYLEALEDGRHEDLPGAVYALGFVRTYAEFLGLDSNEVVARYKEETQGLKSQSYVMPEPLEEGKVPTAAILLVAVVLAAAAYGGWYFYTQQPGGRAAQEVPDVPERLSAVTEAPAPAVVPPVLAPQDTAQAMPPPAAAPVAAPVEVETPPPVATAPPAPAPQPPAETTAPTPVEAAAPPAPPTTEPETMAAPEAPAPEPAEDVAVAVPAAPPPPPEPQAPEQPLAPAPPPAAEAPEVPVDVVAAVPPVPTVADELREPRVYGLDNVGARIVITAEEDAWLEVTDSDDARLFSRVLRRGDSYRAPNRDGTKFVTGNAGGLRITVDGETVPTLGPPGQVRRDVKLDPELLKSGRAWP